MGKQTMELDATVPHRSSDIQHATSKFCTCKLETERCKNE